MSRDPESDAPFSVLVVCTANRCRSPMAEYLLGDALRALGVRWSVSSAGTHAVSGSPMDPSAEAVLAIPREDVSNWSSRRLDEDLIDRADLILTAEGVHRSRVVTLRPDALSRTFTLLQFGRIATHVDKLNDPTGGAAGDLLLERVLAARAHVQPGMPGADDIPDPIGRRRRAFRACAETIDSAVAAITAPLATPRSAKRASHSRTARNTAT